MDLRQRRIELAFYRAAGQDITRQAVTQIGAFITFLQPNTGDLRAVYGLAGMVWRMPLLWALGYEVDNERFLLDGICVAKVVRGFGIGSALMAAISAEGATQGYSHIRLDVVDSNVRAKALYERLGFAIEKTDDIGLLFFAFGFRHSHTMIKAL